MAVKKSIKQSSKKKISNKKKKISRKPSIKKGWYSRHKKTIKTIGKVTTGSILAAAGTAVGIAALWFAVLGTFGCGNEWRRGAGRWCHGPVRRGQRPVFNGWALALASRAGAGLWAMGYSYCRLCVVCQLCLGALDGLGTQHCTLVRCALNVCTAGAQRSPICQQNSSYNSLFRV